MSMTSFGRKDQIGRLPLQLDWIIRRQALVLYETLYPMLEKV
jgi:hypothetical protein